MMPKSLNAKYIDIFGEIDWLMVIRTGAYFNLFLGRDSPLFIIYLFF